MELYNGPTRFKEQYVFNQIRKRPVICNKNVVVHYCTCSEWENMEIEGEAIVRDLYISKEAVYLWI